MLLYLRKGYLIVITVHYTSAQLLVNDNSVSENKPNGPLLEEHSRKAKAPACVVLFGFGPTLGSVLPLIELAFKLNKNADENITTILVSLPYDGQKITNIPPGTIQIKLKPESEIPPEGFDKLAKRGSMNWFGDPRDPNRAERMIEADLKVIAVALEVITKALEDKKDEDKKNNPARIIVTSMYRPTIPTAIEIAKKLLNNTDDIETVIKVLQNPDLKRIKYLLNNKYLLNPLAKKFAKPNPLKITSVSILDATFCDKTEIFVGRGDMPTHHPISWLKYLWPENLSRLRKKIVSFSALVLSIIWAHKLNLIREEFQLPPLTWWKHLAGISVTVINDDPNIAPLSNEHPGELAPAIQLLIMRLLYLLLYGQHTLEIKNEKYLHTGGLIGALPDNVKSFDDIIKRIEQERITEVVVVNMGSTGIQKYGKDILKAFLNIDQPNTLMIILGAGRSLEEIWYQKPDKEVPKTPNVIYFKAGDLERLMGTLAGKLSLNVKIVTHGGKGSLYNLLHLMMKPNIRKIVKAIIGIPTQPEQEINLSATAQATKGTIFIINNHQMVLWKVAEGLLEILEKICRTLKFYSLKKVIERISCKVNPIRNALLSERSNDENKWKQSLQIETPERSYEILVNLIKDIINDDKYKLVI